MMSRGSFKNEPEKSKFCYMLPQKLLPLNIHLNRIKNHKYKIKNASFKSFDFDTSSNRKRTKPNNLSRSKILGKSFGNI